MKDYPKLFIFDLDGVITDTAEQHYVAWKEMAQSIGIEIDREFNESLKGVSRGDSLDKILNLNHNLHVSEEQKTELMEKKNEAYRELITSIEPEDIYPGIGELLERLRENSIKIALGSASKNAPFIIKQLQIEHHFDYVVDPASVENGKPAPDIFLKAADELDVAYEECVGIEDAIAGVTAINEAGMFSVGVGDEAQLDHADYVVADTAELKLEAIIDRFDEANRKM
ncbi:beta-phosphoglucomutase [Salimicrobium halophilum]|uniref:Beta-phosphoglucomutase n=1 Tax=Salimicrobium halophilum TaxID=86666 RepID=A0A1G8UXN1_9BACI|nr:beta-phosphoglucomutase [Salimicrobium halophilum]SDJ57680.1 beta-phosphoglucomutase [Salimicrobium halophilum]